MEEYYERVFDTTTVAATASYRINKRCALSRINSVQIVQSGAAYTLQRLEPKRAIELSPTTVTGTPWAYYLEGGRIVLFPTPPADLTLRVRAMVRPSRLILTTDTTNCLQITAVTTNATTYSLTTAAHSIGSTAIRDVVAGTPSFEHLAVDATVTQTSTLVTTSPITGYTTAPIVGDYVCLSDYTPMVQLPVELQPALVELTIVRLLRARGVSGEAADHLSAAERMIQTGIAALTPRVDTANRKIVGGPHFRRRGFGTLRGV